jgi:hypothetical protein
MADLDQIMSERPQEHDSNQPEQRQEAPQQVEQQGQQRDENGRFAAQQQQPAPEAPQPEPAKPPEGYIPIQALDARLSKTEEKYQNMLREQALDFQRQMAALQQHQPKPEPPKPVDFFENPDAAFESRMQQAVQPIQQGQQQIVENFSRMYASDKYGEEAVNSALAEMTRRVQAQPEATRFDYQRIMSSPHPYGELVKWHKAQTTLSTYGDDPEAYIKAEVEKRLASQLGQQQQQAPAVDPNSLPTSFNRNSGPSAVPQWSGPKPLSDLMGR